MKEILAVSNLDTSDDTNIQFWRMLKSAVQENINAAGYIFKPILLRSESEQDEFAQKLNSKLKKLGIPPQRQLQNLPALILDNNVFQDWKEFSILKKLSSQAPIPDNGQNFETIYRQQGYELLKSNSKEKKSSDTLTNEKAGALVARFQARRKGQRNDDTNDDEQENSFIGNNRRGQGLKNLTKNAQKQQQWDDAEEDDDEIPRKKDFKTPSYDEEKTISNIINSSDYDQRDKDIMANYMNLT